MPDTLSSIRHSLAHLLATAALEHDPAAKLSVGPVIDNGFYYDIEFSEGRNPSSEDLKRLEKTMRHLVKKNLDFIKKEVTAEQARAFFSDNPYKLAIIDDLEQAGTAISLYETGNFTDLCVGGHVENTREIDPHSFTLTHLAGAYWRGDEKNPMLTRVYGIAFESKALLEIYLERQEEAKKRDHRKLGKELDLFTFSPLVGAGLPLFTPKGTVLRSELQNALLSISKKYGMQPVTIPHIAKRDLYVTSGHAEKFSDELIKVISHYDEFVMKPVNCPHHTQIYASRPRSYRDLPLRYMESTMQYRDEQPGEIGGLTRVRAITVDDGHIFCRVDQIKEEAKSIANIIKEFYSSLGMYGNHWVSLSVRDLSTPEKYIGDDADWDTAETMLQEISNDLSLDAKRMEGEAALYGPKLDYMFTDSLGRERQLATIQIDFAMPKRFGLSYTGSDGKEETPVMIHRAILGSYERFMAILIEHFAGAFPLWLSPVQIAILPVSEKHRSYAEELLAKFQEIDIRTELHGNDESLGKRIRTAKMQKIPYLLVVGDKEIENRNVSVESRDDGQLGTKSLDETISLLQEKIQSKQ
ncbi:MAG: threonine--tRNA ligase [Patescibacteria group bacterium]